MPSTIALAFMAVMTLYCHYMSSSRQSLAASVDGSGLITGISERWASALGLEKHSHSHHQLLYARQGVAHVETAQGSWILPPTRAIWIGAGTEHAFRARRPVFVTVLYIDPDMAGTPDWPSCVVVDVSPLVRELIAACAEQGSGDLADLAAARLSRVLLDRLVTLPQAPVALPAPRDPRAARVADLVRDDPADRRSIAQLAATAGTTARTVERLFAAETGISFGAWRARHTMVVALEFLAEHKSVDETAFTLGYQSASSFIAAFRRMFGTTPSRYYNL